MLHSDVTGVQRGRKVCIVHTSKGLGLDVGMDLLAT